MGELAGGGAGLEDDAAVGGMGALRQHHPKHGQAGAGKDDLAVPDLTGGGDGHEFGDSVVRHGHPSSRLRRRFGL